MSAPRCYSGATRRPNVEPNAYRMRAERGEVQIGTWITMIRTPGVLTLLQAAGLDFARVDMEHSPFSMETVADMAVLARALDFPMVVRPPEGNREWITRLLDVGGWGLHIPQVDNPDIAHEIVGMPGIDAVTLGPSDLAQELGVRGTPDQARVIDEHRRMLIAAASKHG